MYFTRLWVPFVAVLAAVRDKKLLAGVAAAAVLLVAPVASAVFYDFESPTYTGGDVTIDGQDGWAGGIRTIITSVDTDQLLRIGSNSIASHSLAGAGIADLTTVSVRTFITNNSNSYGEIQLFDSTNTKYAHIGFQNLTDHFYVYDNAGYLGFDANPVYGGNYYNVVVTLDFAAQKYRTTFTHEDLAALHADTGFVNFIAPTTTTLAEGGRIDLLGGSAANRFAYFDKLSIGPANIMVEGDYNGNGFVDAADYVLWRKNNGLMGGATVAQGDGTGDGNVLDDDYAYWRERFGNPTPGSGAALGGSEVPEPAAVLLLSLGLFSGGTLVGARLRGTRL